ncbi:MAG: hypothetical protein JST23_04045 [Bacteroidetes bacterium]|nr:hypothetical protein [Bacteroidota bacterium]
MQSAHLGLAKVGCLGSAPNAAAEQSPPSPSQPHVTGKRRKTEPPK